jgi:hypothetical protein
MHGTQGRSSKALLNPASMGRQLMDGGAARPGKAELLIEFCVSGRSPVVVAHASFNGSVAGHVPEAAQLSAFSQH